MTDRPRLLDLTRLVTRVGRGPLTGIDRVEAAYLDRFLADPLPAGFLVSLRREHLLLGKPAACAFRERLAGRAAWGPPDLRARLALRLPAQRRRAEASLRREAEDRAPPDGLAAMLGRAFPRGAEVFSVGHANLEPATLAAIKAVRGLRLQVLVHDTIPLDHPEFARAGTVAPFERRMRAVAAHADRVLFPSRHARRRAEAHFAAWGGRIPPAAVAPLGVTLAAPEAAALPPGLPPPAPWFVALGTIEPRKNHALLLDVWESFVADLPASEIPHLVIIGSRGWAGAALIRRLDRSPVMGRHVTECPGLPDGAAAALLAGAAGLLMPSRAEGYGLPPLEAAALGVPVLAAPLPVYRETLGDNAVYADPDDRYLWAQTIRALTERQGSGHGLGQNGAFVPPRWDEHFKHAFTMS